MLVYTSHQPVIYLEEAKPRRIRNEAVVDNCTICRCIVLTMRNMHLQLQLSLSFVSGGVLIIERLGVLWIFKLNEMSRTWTTLNQWNIFSSEQTTEEHIYGWYFSILICPFLPGYTHLHLSILSYVRTSEPF